MPRPKPCLLLTRARADAERFVGLLDQQSLDAVDVVYAPLIEIRVCAPSVDQVEPRSVIFTSSNGVRAAKEHGIDTNLPCFCVGSRTTEVAKAEGWPAAFAGATAAELVETLRNIRPQAPLLHLRGTHARGDIAERLTCAGLPTAERIIYDQVLLPLSESAESRLKARTPVIVPLFSPRTARQFANHRGTWADLYIAAISPAVAETVKKLENKEIIVSDRPDAATVARCVQDLITRVSRVEG